MRSGTSREWQRYSTEHKDVTPYDILLKFVDLQARYCGNAMHGEQKRTAGTANKKGLLRPSYVANVSSDKGNCMVCKREQHHLLSCRVFLGFLHSIG